MVIFTTQLEVAEDNSYFGTRDEKNKEDYKEEAEYVVELVKPYGG